MGKTGSHKNAASELRGRPCFSQWITVTLVLIVLLVYFLAIRPGKRKVRLQGASSCNILLVTLDTTRADRLGCYGYPSAQTPNLDRLAREGIRFARVYCPAPLTLPSHCSILTGLDPVTHGVHNNGHNLPQGIRTLAEILKGHGYSTSAFVSSFSVDSRFGIDRGFDVYDDTFQSASAYKTQDEERRAELTFDHFSRWLEKNGEDKFFSWVHYYDPHAPYDPPPPYKEEFADRPYDGEIAYMDQYVGALLDSLREKGILERTIIVIAGDHGEGLGKKLELGHGIFLYEDTLRVPLILYNAQVFPGSQLIESQVRLIDVAPTLLDIIGLKDEASDMRGQSLVAWLKGKSRQDLDSLVETFYTRENFGWSELVGLVSRRWKFIQAPQPELYDLEKDPEEEVNLYETSAERARELKKKLEEVLQASSSGRPTAGEVSSRPEDLERLRALGYVSLAPAKMGPVLPDPKEKAYLIRWMEQAQKDEYEGKLAEAEQAYLKIIEAAPDSPAAVSYLASVQALQFKYDHALETLKNGVSKFPDSDILMLRLGHTYMITGRTRESLETMNRALTLNPQAVGALTVCAGILDTEGRNKEARSYYERALAIEPESRYLRMKYAANLVSGGHLREAIGVYEKLIADFPEDQAFCTLAGRAHSDLGEYDLAISYMEKALAVLTTALGYFNLAEAYEKGGRLQDAAKYFRLFLENSEHQSEDNLRKARAELESLEKKLSVGPKNR